MSKAQGDHFRTWTDEGLNKYLDEVFYPRRIEMIDFKEKEYRINGGKIICESRNIVKCEGFKLRSLEVTGKEYIIRVYSDENSSLSDVVNTFNNKDEANENFRFWKMQLEV